MPIYRLLQNAPFGPEEIRRVAAAFEQVLVDLNVTDRTHPLAATVARKIFEIAQTGERNPATMRMQALNSLGLSQTASASVSDLDQSGGLAAPDNIAMEWKPIATAPFDRDLELAVIDYDGTHALVFPCRRVLYGWIDAKTKRPIDHLQPTHWREWRGSA